MESTGVSCLRTEEREFTLEAYGKNREEAAGAGEPWRPEELAAPMGSPAWWSEGGSRATRGGRWGSGSWGGGAVSWAKLGWLDRLLGSLLSLMNNKTEQRKERKEREVRGKICAWG